MLKLMRKNTKTIIWIISISFIFFGIGTAILSGITGKKYVGEVYGKKIPEALFLKKCATVYFSLKVQSLLARKEDITNALIENSTFQHIAFVKAAKKRGIKVSDNELQEEIVRRFSINGNFSPQVYEKWVKLNTGLSLRDYEEGVREELMIEKLIKSIKDSVSVTDEEVKNYFLQSNRKIKVGYVSIDTLAYENDVKFSKEDIVKFYQANLDKFKTERKYKLNYIYFNPENYADDVKITDNELTEFFSSNKDKFNNMFPAGENADFDKVKDIIRDELSYKKKILLAKEAALNFKRSITNISELKNAAESAGLKFQYLSFSTFNEIIEKFGYSPKLENKLIRVRPNMLILANTANGVYLINVTDVREPKLVEYMEAKEKAVKLYKAEKSYEIAYKKIKEVKEIALKGIGLKNAASEAGFNYNETDYFGISDNAVINRKITAEIFNAMWSKKKGEIGNIISADKFLFLPELIDFIEPEKGLYEKEYDKLREQILSFKQFVEVQKKLSDILKEAKIKRYNKKRDVSEI